MKLTFPFDNLNLSPYTTQPNSTYTLTSVIEFLGTSNKGHYKSFSKKPNSDTWIEYDDDIVRTIDRTILNNTTRSYILFYTRLQN